MRVIQIDGRRRSSAARFVDELAASADFPRASSHSKPSNAEGFVRRSSGISEDSGDVHTIVVTATSPIVAPLNILRLRGASSTSTEVWLTTVVALWVPLAWHPEPRLAGARVRHRM